MGPWPLLLLINCVVIELWCQNGEVFSVQFAKSMLIFYVQLCPSEDIHWRSLAHEQAAAVFQNISHQNPSCQAKMVSAGTIKHLVKLCDMLNTSGSHSNCCQSVYQCSREANALFHDLTFQKKLVGKVTEMSLTTLLFRTV